MIESLRSRSLKRFWERNDDRGIRRDWVARIKMILDALNAAAQPDDMNLPGLKFHALKGDRKGEYAVYVSRNWRITFAWSGQDATQVDLEDYHGE
jgi:proteic killer suppression protein